MSTDDAELYELVDQAKPLGLFVGRHKYFDASKGGGPYFVSRRGQSGAMLLRYATAADVEYFLNREAAA